MRRFRNPKSKIQNPKSALTTLALVILLLAGPALAAENRPPHADAGPDQRVKVNRTVFFGASNSSDPDGDRLSYSWDYDAADGIQTDSTWLAPSHTYNSTGNYTVTLTVSDGSLTDTDTMTVEVFQNHPPAARFTAPRYAYTGERLYFDGRNSSDPDGDFVTVSWDFDASNGIGNDSKDRVADWTYTMEGTYTVTLTASDGELNSSATATVEVVSGVRFAGGKVDESGTVFPGRSTAYMVSLRKGDSISVNAGIRGDARANILLFDAQNYQAFLNGSGTKYFSGGSDLNSTGFTYRFSAAKGDDYYIVFDNPSGENISYTISLVRKRAEPPKGSPGFELLSLAAAAVILTSILRRRR